MPPRPALSKSELRIARTIWELGRATVGQVFQALPEDAGIDYTTVQTYIRRLEQKGYIRATRSGRNKIYSPRVQARRVIKETVDDLMDRLFDGEVIPLMRHLIQDRQIQPDEIEALRQLLNQFEASEDERDSQ